MERIKYYQIKKFNNNEVKELAPVKISKFPNDVVEGASNYIQDTYKIEKGGTLDLISVFWVKKSSKKEMSEFENTCEYKSDQLPGYLFYTVEEQQ